MGGALAEYDRNGETALGRLLELGVHLLGRERLAVTLVSVGGRPSRPRGWTIACPIESDARKDGAIRIDTRPWFRRRLDWRFRERLCSAFRMRAKRPAV